MKKQHYTELSAIIEKYTPVLKRHAWWILPLVSGITYILIVGYFACGVRSADDDVKKRALGENMLKIFNYLPNKDSITPETVFLSPEAEKFKEQTSLALKNNYNRQVEIKQMYPFLKIIPVTVIDSLRDFPREKEAVIYFRHFDYTALVKDSLTLFPKFYRCVDNSNIVEFRNFQLFSSFCEKGLPYKKQQLFYKYKKVRGHFYAEKYLIR